MSRSTSAANRKSWKQTAATRRKGSNEAKRNSKFGFTLLAVLLLGMFIAMMLIPTKPRTYFVQLPILNYDRLIPPVEYVAGDYEALDSLPDATNAILHTKSLDILSNSESVDKFPDLFANEKLLPKDVLILFVSAHGFSEDGEAYIACSDFLRNSSTKATGIYPLKKFLNHVENCEASTKLIVLDTGRLQYDPRIGLIVNEFPLILADEMESRGDPNLFVLMGTGMMQYPNVMHGQQRSLFASTVVRGLTGAADSLEGNEIEEPDDKVNLAELYKYVVDAMADYYPQESSMAQHPYLLQGGKGVLRDFSAVEDVDTFLISLDDIRDAERAAEEAAKEAEEKAKEAAEAEEVQAQRSSRRANSLANRLAMASNLFAWQQAQPETPANTGNAATPATTDPGTPPADAAAGEGNPPAPANPTTTPTPQPVAPSPKLPDAETEKDDESRNAKLRDAIHAAWSERDHLESRTIRGGWSPVDFAPHYWRAMTERLVDYEHRYLAGSDYELETLATEVEAEVKGLKQLSTLMARDQAPTQISPAPLVSMSLLTAWRNFVNDGVLKENYERAEGEAAETKRARLLYHDQMHRAVYYVRWHEFNSFAMADGAPGVQEVSTFLDELALLQVALAGDRSPGELASRVARLDTIRGQLDDIIGQELRSAMESASTPAGQRKLNDMLATPLLDSTDRRNVLRELEKPRGPLNRSNHVAHKTIPKLGISAAQWRALSNRLRHRALLCKAADPQFYPIVNEQLIAIADPAPTAGEATLNLLATYRALGSRLAQFYQIEIPQKIEAGKGAALSDGAGVPAARRALRMLDARDVDRIGLPPFPMFKMLPEVDEPDTEFVRVESKPEQLSLSVDPSHTQRVEVSLKHRGEGGEFATIILRFDPSAVGVKNAQNGKELRPEERIQVPLTPDRRLNQGELSLDVWAKKDTSEAELESPLTIGAVVANLRSQSQVTCTLPNPDFVELLVQRTGAPRPHNDENGKITMRPFPNRETGYLMTLRNHSGVEKEVTAQLLAVPKPANPAWGPGQLFYSNNSKLYLHQDIHRDVFIPSTNRLQVDSRVEVLAQTKPFSLPADIDREVNVPLEKPGAAVPEGAAPPPPASGDEKNPDISHGLAMVIRETGNPNSTWVKWIEIRPQSPAEYMSTRIKYDATLEQIQVSVKPDATDSNNDRVLDRVPMRLADKPIEVSWDLARSGLTGYSGSTVGEFRGGDPDQPVELYVNGVESDGTKREIWLTVDGYPRALAFTVVCDEAQPGAAIWDDPNRNLRQTAENLALRWITMPNETVPEDYKKQKLDRMFFYTPDAKPQLELDQMAKGQEKVATFLEYGQPAWFPEEKRTAPVAFQYIDVRVEVDAPRIAFDSGTSEKDEIIIGFEGQQPERFYSDREMKMELTSITPDGQLRLNTAIDDYTVRVKTQGISHQRKNFIAQLIRSNQVRSGNKPHPIIFDDQRPEIDNFGAKNNLSRPIPVGEPIELFVEARALSGIDRVEFALDLTGDKDWAKLEPVIDRTDGLIRLDNKFGASLSTEDLKEGRRYKLLARAFDKIGYYESQTLELSFTTAKPAPAGNGGNQDVFGTVKGVVSKGTFKDFSAGQIKITLEGGGEPTKRTTNGPGGTFEFKNVKVGPQYKLTAEGKFQQRPIFGELEGVTATPGGGTPKPFNVKMDRDERPSDPPR